MPIIPLLFANFNVYLDGLSQRYLGVSTVGLPNIDMMTEEVKMAGQNGPIDQPVVGHVMDMSCEINITTLGPQISTFLQQRGVTISLRAALQLRDTSNNNFVKHGWRFALQTFPKTFHPGKLEVGTKSEGVITRSVSMYAAYENGVERWMVDKDNEIFRVDGVDYLADIHQFT